MENIKEFLVGNYGYIIAVIILIIITIVGFLADKKGKTASKDILPNNNPNPGNVSPDQPAANNINNQPINNMAVGNGFGQAPIQPEQSNNLNILPGNIQGTIISQNMNMTPNQVPVEPTPVAPVNNSMMNAPEPMYQPLSEQKPVIAPAEPMPINIVPNPVEPVNNSMMNAPEPMYQPLSEQKPVIAPVEPINNIQNFNQNQANNPINFGPVNSNLNAPNMMNTNNPGIIPAPQVGTSPAPIPTPQPVPVSPVPIPNPQQVPNMPTGPQPLQGNTMSPANFVYGAPPQNQNINGNMQ